MTAMTTPNTPNAAERPSVDALANFIRASNGYNTPGADRLAERIYAWLDDYRPLYTIKGHPCSNAQPQAVSDEDIRVAAKAFSDAETAYMAQGCANPNDPELVKVATGAALESFAKRTAVSDENLAIAIANELARIDGYDPEDQHGGLYDMQWSEGSAPEPLGDEFSMNYLPKGERIAEWLKLNCLTVVQGASREDGRELRRLCEHRDQLKRKLAEVRQQRDDMIVDLARASSAREILTKALRALAEGCAFPTDEVMKAVRDRCRDALAKAGDA